MGETFRRVLTTERVYDLIRFAELNRKFCISKLLVVAGSEREQE